MFSFQVLGGRALSEVHRVYKQLWRWVRKFRRISVNPSRIPRRVIVLDETCVKVNGLEYWVYAGC